MESKLQGKDLQWARNCSRNLQSTKKTNSSFLLNCAAAVKILKKHDKCTGSDLRWNYIHHVEAQDFYVLQPQFQEYTKQCERLMGVGELEQPSMSDENWTWSMVI